MKRTEPTTHILRGHAYTPACKTDIRRTIERAQARLLAERMRQIEPTCEDGAPMQIVQRNEEEEHLCRD